MHPEWHRVAGRGCSEGPRGQADGSSSPTAVARRRQQQRGHDAPRRRRALEPGAVASSRFAVRRSRRQRSRGPRRGSPGAPQRSSAASRGSESCELRGESGSPPSRSGRLGIRRRRWACARRLGAVVRSGRRERRAPGLVGARGAAGAPAPRRGPPRAAAVRGVEEPALGAGEARLRGVVVAGGGGARPRSASSEQPCHSAARRRSCAQLGARKSNSVPQLRRTRPRAGPGPRRRLPPRTPWDTGTGRAPCGHTLGAPGVRRSPRRRRPSPRRPAQRPPRTRRRPGARLLGVGGCAGPRRGRPGPPGRARTCPAGSTAHPRARSRGGADRGSAAASVPPQRRKRCRARPGGAPQTRRPPPEASDRAAPPTTAQREPWKH